MDMKVRCMNKACLKVIDVKEKELHVKIYHPNYRSLFATTSIYYNADRFKTPKEIVKLLFSEIISNGNLEAKSNEV